MKKPKHKNKARINRALRRCKCKESPKPYKQKQVNPEAWKVAVMGQCKLNQYDQDKFAESVKLAVDNVARACASKADWQAIFDVANMLDTFSTMPKVMKDATDYVRGLQRTIEAIINRQRERNTRALYAQELAALREMVDLWVEVLQWVTMAEYLQCQEKTHGRIIKALRSNKNAIVVEAP